MVRYYDSSILPACILEQPPRELIASLWGPVQIRLSSILIKIECVVGVRRAAAMQGLAGGDSWCTERIHLLEPYLEALHCRRVDDDIIEILKANPFLSGCRPLDAIHVATAIHYRPYHDEPMGIVTLDARMRETAERVGFLVLP